MKKKNKQKKNTNNKFNFDNEFIIGVSTSNNKNNKNDKVKKKKNVKKQKKKKKIKINVKLLVRNLCLLLFIIATIAFFLVSPTFNVQEITVENNSLISSEKIVSLSEIKLFTNIFKVNKKNAIKKIKSQDRYIESVEIKKKLPNKIIISVEERQREFMIEIAEGKYTYISSQGYILETSNEKLELPILTGFSTEKDKLVGKNVVERLNNNDLEKLNTVLKLIEISKEYEINKLISKIDISDKNNYVLTLESENKIAYLGDDSNLNTKVLFLKEILSAEKGIKGEIFLNVDLNEENVYFRESV